MVDVIELESVGKTFRNGTSAVADLSLTVPSDKITAIVGPPGCGQTTTLRMVNRLIEPTSGRILWDGVPLRSRRRTAVRREMGYVTRSAGLFPHRTVVENIGTVPDLLGWSRAKSDKRSSELLDLVGLDRAIADRYPGQLTAGQQHRVGVARALAADPLVLLMDEPFSAVDPAERSELHQLFLRLQHEVGKTVVLVTHDIDEAVTLGDQVVILRVGGRLAQVGSPREVLDAPADAFVEGFVGRDRGYRVLSFLPAGDLALESVPVVRDVGAARSGEPTLVVDQDARPLGWVEDGHPGRLLPLGATFNTEGGTLRTALDSALSSPVGMAVGVTAGGRYAGVVAAATVLAHVAGSHAQPSESVRVSPTAASSAAAPPLAEEVESEAGGTAPVEPDEPDRRDRAELGDESGHAVDPGTFGPEEEADLVPVGSPATTGVGDWSAEDAGAVPTDARR